MILKNNIIKLLNNYIFFKNKVISIVSGKHPLSIFKYSLLYFFFMFIIILYIKFFFKLYVICYCIFIFIFIFCWIFNKEINININVKLINSVKPSNLLIFILYNFVVKLPILISFLLFYNSLSTILNKKDINVLSAIKSYTYKFLFNFIFNIPFFVLNSSLNMLKIYINQEQLGNQIENKDSFSDLILNFLSNYSISTIGYYMLVTSLLNVHLISRFNIVLNPGNTPPPNPNNLNKFLNLFIKQPSIRVGRFKGINKSHVTFLSRLKSLFGEYNSLNCNFTTPKSVPNQIPITIRGKGYKAFEHGVTPLYQAKLSEFNSSNSVESMNQISDILNDPYQLSLIALSFAYHYDKTLYFSQNGVLISQNKSLQEISKENNFNLFEIESNNMWLSSLEDLHKEDPFFCENTEANIIISNFFKNSVWNFQDFNLNDLNR